MGFMSGFVEGFFFNTDNRTYWLPQHFGVKAAFLQQLAQQLLVRKN